MFLTDLHTHSVLSMDGHAPLREMARAAVDAGLRALCITDHCDLLDAVGERKLTYDWAPALRQYAETAPEFAGRLELRLGIELGGAFAAPEHARAILAGAGPELDFVIGSIHTYSEGHGGGDFYFVHYDAPEICYDALDDYFSSMAVLAEQADCYDVLGHIIYPLRYMADRDGQPVTLERYRDRIAAILRTVIAQDRGIEVNTCRGRTVEPWRDVLTLYKDLGGKLVTVGSDAHLPGDVGKGIAESCALLRAVGFSRVAVYRKRRPALIEL